MILKKNYKVFIIVFLSILSFSFIFSAANYIKYTNNIERYKILKKYKEVHNSLDRVLAKDRFFKAAEKGDIERIKELMDYVDMLMELMP